MEVQIYQHYLHQNLQFYIFSTLKVTPKGRAGRQELIDFSSNNYLLRVDYSSSQLVVIDDNFTTIQKTLSLPKIDSSQCLSFIKTQHSCYLVMCIKQTIYLYTLKTQISKTTKSIKEMISEGDYFRNLSKTIKIQECYLHIAYTQNNRFYLIAIKKNGNLSVQKLNNRNDIHSPKGLFEWCYKQTKSYSYIKLQLSRIDKGDQFLRVLVVRDNIITLHLVELHLEISKSQITLLSQTKQIIQNNQEEHKIKSVIFQPCYEMQPRKIIAFIAYTTKDRFLSISKLTINFIATQLFHFDILIPNLSNHDFQMAFHKDYIYYSAYNPQKQVYELYRNKVSYLQGSKQTILIDEFPFWTNQSKLIFNSNSQKLIIISANSINSIKDQEQVSDFSQQQKEWVSYKGTVSLIYSKKITNAIDQSFEVLTRILSEKQSKMIGWFKQHSRHLSTEDNHITQILGIEIVLTSIIKNLVIYMISSQNVNDRLLFSKKELFTLGGSCQPRDIVFLLDSLINNNKKLNVFLCLVRHLRKLQIMSKCIEGIKTILQEPIHNIFEQVQQNNSQIEIQMLKSLIQQMTHLNMLEINHLELILRAKQAEFIKKLILEHKLWPIFIEFFVKEKIPINTVQLRHFQKTLMKENKYTYQQFISILLHQYHQMYLQFPEVIYRKIDILIDGLIPFLVHVISDVQIIFPGLAFFLYIRAGNRRDALQWMESIDLQIQSLRHLKLVFLTVFDLFHNAGIYNFKDKTSIFSRLFEQNCEQSQNIRYLISRQFEKKSNSAPKKLITDEGQKIPKKYLKL